MSEVYWFLTDYMDEVPVHGPTLQEAAYFLQHGKRADDDPETEVWGAPPLAKPGDVVSLSSLTMLGDVTARRVTREDGKTGWDFDPPLPPVADFMAVRWGAGAGWDADTICNPANEGATDDHFNELFPEEEAVENIAVGYHGDWQGVFYIAEGVPRLQLIGDLARLDAQPDQLALELGVPDDRGLPLLEPEPELTRAARDVVAERQRQIIDEGFTPAHDDQSHGCGAMSRAAACYARGPQFLMMHKMGDGQGNIVDVPVDWPWAPSWWKPRSRREDLVRAGALILAEIERIDRAAEGQG